MASEKAFCVLALVIGLGYLLVDGQQLGKPDQILAAIIAFALMGKAADSILLALTRPLVRWQDVARERL